MSPRGVETTHYRWVKGEVPILVSEVGHVIE